MHCFIIKMKIRKLNSIYYWQIIVDDGLESSQRIFKIKLFNGRKLDYSTRQEQQIAKK